MGISKVARSQLLFQLFYPISPLTAEIGTAGAVSGVEGNCGATVRATHL